MTPEMLDLAKRAVTCEGWRWMPGMADLWGGRMREGDGIDRLHALPDLTDPATLGCLLMLVREAWGQPLVSVRWSVHGWRVLNTEGRAWCWRIGKGSTEAEALVVALENAPCR